MTAIKNSSFAKTVRYISIAAVILTAAASLMLFVTGIRIRVLPRKYLVAMLAVLIPFNLFFGYIGLSKKVNSLNKGLQIFFCSLLSAAMIFVSIVIPQRYQGRIEQMFTPLPDTTELHLNIYVMKDSPATELQQLSGKTMGIQKELDGENQEVAVEDINKMVTGEAINMVVMTDIYGAAEALYNGTVDAVLLNEVYADILADNTDFASFIDDTRIIYTVTQEVVDEHNKPVPGITNTPFVVAVAGNDSYSYSNLKPSSRGRTDVNILLVVNPNTKQVLMITIPRDSYLPINGNNNKKDKLTHASVYGMKTWVKTLEKAFDCDINYYVRVNFSSLVNVVDAIGGIDIDNPYSFTAYGNKDYYYPTGMIHLDGDKALGYCRERKSLSNGDMGRNAHQGIVLKALIAKATSKDIITKFDDLLDAVKGSFVTDLTVDEMYELVRMQLNDMATWKVTTYNLTGKSGMAPSYAYGGRNLAMVFLNDDKVATAKQKIQDMLAVEGQ